jgi:tetratricopeptide (TPR) repeat protein
MLHSGGRRFGPLSEDEIRNYFRAGMVKSVDRISAPGDPLMRAASEVATALGETVPIGPPPPPLEPAAPAAPTPAAPAPPTPAAPVAAIVQPAAATPAAAVDAEAAAAQLEREQRAARAIAAMKLDLAALASEPRSRTGPGWLVPVVLVVVLIAALFMGLSMLKKMAPGGHRATGVASAGQDSPTMPGASMVAADPAGAQPPQVTSPPEALVAAPAPSPAGDTQGQMALQRADALMRAEDWAGLVSHSEQWSRAQPERDEPWELLGIAYARLRDYNSAAEALRHLLARDPGNAKHRAMLADVYLQAQRLGDAADMYKQVVADSPGDARVWNNYGTALMGTGQVTQAIAALETAVKLDPSLKQAWNNLGSAYKAKGDSARATAAFANAR